MSVKLIDLQLIYGVAGAREKFEDLASQLVERMGDRGLPLIPGRHYSPGHEEAAARSRPWARGVQATGRGGGDGGVD